MKNMTYILKNYRIMKTNFKKLIFLQIYTGLILQKIRNYIFLVYS